MFSNWSIPLKRLFGILDFTYNMIVYSYNKIV
nr:MAG TPA: hypothetical protein [Caudoviricetes sp.]